MAIANVNIISVGNINGVHSNLTLTGAQANDIVYICGGHSNTTANSGVMTGGYTNVAFALNGSGYRFGVYRKVMGTTPDATANCIGSLSSADAIAYVGIILRGANTTVPEHAVSGPNRGSSTTPSSNAITVTKNSVWAISMVGSGVNDGSVTQPTGYINTVQISGGNDTTDSSVGLATKEVSTNETPGAWTNWVSGTWVGFTIGVNPNDVKGRNYGYIIT